MIMHNQNLVHVAIIYSNIIAQHHYNDVKIIWQQWRVWMFAPYSFTDQIAVLFLGAEINLKPK